jgi:hypothetical protein
MTVEPIHGMVYFTPLAQPAYEALGLADRQGYFASRAAAMGAVSAEMVISTFFNFSPDLVRSAIPAAWQAASPESVLAARYGVVRATFNQFCGEHVHSADTTRAAEIAKALALDVCHRVDGRPLFAAHAALPWPSDDNPALVLWHAQTLLREFRGDGHIAVLVAEGLSGLDAHITHIATGQLPEGIMRATRGWADDDYERGVASLVARGVIERTPESVTLTARGLAQRESIEARTDELAAAPYVAAGEALCAELRRSARPFAKAVIAANLSPLRRLPEVAPDGS